MEETDGFYIFEYDLDNTFKGPLIIDMSFPECSEEQIKLPLEKNGVDFSVFTQILDTIDG